MIFLHQKKHNFEFLDLSSQIKTWHEIIIIIESWNFVR